MCDAANVEVKTTVQEFAEKEYLGAPLNTMLHARFPQELVEIALDRKNKAYARTAAIGECFRIMNTNLIEQQQRKQMAQIREHLAALEDGSGPDVIDV